MYVYVCVSVSGCFVVVLSGMRDCGGRFVMKCLLRKEVAPRLCSLCAALRVCVLCELCCVLLLCFAVVVVVELVLCKVVFCLVVIL